MSLKYAILGLLSLKPQSGYELKLNFEQSIKYLWNADQAQIYRTLDTISKNGLVKSYVIEQTNRPNKKVYEITEEGENELKIWLSKPIQSKSPHNAELLQIFFLANITDEEILINLKRIRENMRIAFTALSSLETKSELFSKKNNSSRVHFFFVSTLKLGIRDMKLNIKWISEMIEEIEAGRLPPK